MSRNQKHLTGTVCVIERLTLTTFFLLTISAEAHSQVAQRIEIPDVPSCARCSVELKPIARLASNDSVGLSATPNVVRDQKGRFYAIVHDASKVAVFGPNGRLQKLIGRKGSGPGEFSSVYRIEIVQGDTLLVFDSMLRRVNVLSPTHNFVRVSPLPIRVTDFAVLGSHWLIHGPGTSPSMAALPLHLFTSGGVHERSVGADPQIVKPGSRVPTWRIAPSLDSRNVWAARSSVFEITKLNEAGQSVLSIVRRAPWWIPHDTTSDAAKNGLEKLPPGVLDLAEVAPGRLLVVLARPDLLFGKVEVKNGVSRARPDIPTVQLEIVDILTQRIVARSMIEKPIYSLGGDMAFSYERDANDEVIILLWQVVVKPN